MAQSAATTDDPRRLYDALAPIYDVWQSSNGMTPFALVATAKLLPLLERHASGGVLSFADLGCGTGTLLHALRASHPDWHLTGLDESGGMLGAATQKPGAGTIQWARSTLGGPLPFARPLDAAGLFYDTLNHLSGPQALLDTFATVARAVRPGGLLVFDLTNRLGFERWWRGCNDFRALRWRLTIDARFDTRTGVGTAEVRIQHESPPRRFTLVERLFSPADVERALGASGFTTVLIEPWSPFDLDVPGKTWWVARRSTIDDSGGK